MENLDNNEIKFLNEMIVTKQVEIENKQNELIIMQDRLNSRHYTSSQSDLLLFTINTQLEHHKKELDILQNRLNSLVGN